MPRIIVFWIIWFAILNGLVIIQVFAGGGIPSGADRGNPPVVFPAVAAGLALAALTIRYVVIPQIGATTKKLSAMVVGLALSEAIGFIGMFAVGSEFAQTRLIFFGAAIGCILSFAPFYAQPAKETGRF